MKVSSPMELYSYLPGTNCKECGQATCIAFAAKLIERSAKTEECKPLLKDKKKYEKLVDVVSPQIREVVIGTGKNAAKIGGEDVLHRHQLTFFNKTALAYDVCDTWSESEIAERVKKIQNFTKFYIGKKLKLDMVAVRCVSDSPETFAKAVKTVSANSDLPLVLCSLNAKALDAALAVVADKKPLLYAATKENWKEVLELAKKYKVPVTLSAPGDLNLLRSMAKTFLKQGVPELVFDPGTYPAGKKLEETFASFIKLRSVGITGEKELNFPLMCIPATVSLAYEGLDASYWETIIAATFVVRYADILLLHSLEPHSVLPIITLRENIYTDPRRPVSVETGVRTLGTPNENSPLFVTTNFALTYYTVENDISAGSTNCYILVVDTGGLGVEAAVAGGQFNANIVKDALEKNPDLKTKVKHNTLILPGLASRISGDAEDATGWKIVVGPIDSGKINNWIAEGGWPPKK